jgi:hypothetical protein
MTDQPRAINLKTYHVLVGMQTQIPNQLNKTWAQDPVIFEDALGRVTHLCLDFISSWDVSFELFPAKHRIKSSLVLCLAFSHQHGAFTKAL